MFPAPKPDPISDHNCQNLYPFSDQNGSKTKPFWAAHTYIPYIGEYPPSPRGSFKAISEGELHIEATALWTPRDRDQPILKTEISDFASIKIVFVKNHYEVNI